MSSGEGGGSLGGYRGAIGTRKLSYHLVGSRIRRFGPACQKVLELRRQTMGQETRHRDGGKNV